MFSLPIMPIYIYRILKLIGCRISASARDEGGPQWYQYFLCGVQGIFGAFPEETKEPKGMRVLVSGTIPQSAGLSSSSALVSAAALTTSYAHQVSYSIRFHQRVQFDLFRTKA